jgi:hypothetical protein
MRTDALPLSYASLRPRQDSNLRPAVYEGTVIYATGQYFLLIRESSTQVLEQESYGTLSIEATPPFRKPIALAGYSVPCISLAEEVTRLYRHG